MFRGEAVRIEAGDGDGHGDQGDGEYHWFRVSTEVGRMEPAQAPPAERGTLGRKGPGVGADGGGWGAWVGPNQQERNRAKQRVAAEPPLSVSTRGPPPAYLDFGKPFR
jgi:hypothetical protein